MPYQKSNLSAKGPVREVIYLKAKLNQVNLKFWRCPIIFDEYIEFHINGEYNGIIDISSSIPPEGLNSRIVSDEVFGGRDDFRVWIGKSNLFTEYNQPDTIKLYIYFEEKIIAYTDDGFFKLTLRPFKEYESVDVKLNNINVGKFDAFGKYTFELPYKAELDTMYRKVYTNERKVLEVIYKIKTSEKLFLGLAGFSGFELIKKDRLTGRLNRGHADGIGFYLPVIYKQN